MSDAERVMRIYDEHVPGSVEAYMSDPATHYARSMMRHLLAIAEIAMRTEQIPNDVRFRILMTMAVGQPSTPVDVELRMATERNLLAVRPVSPPWLPRSGATVGRTPQERPPEHPLHERATQTSLAQRPGFAGVRLEVQGMLSSGRARELRERHGLSFEDCARDCGVSTAAYFRWERGDRSPKGRNVVELHRFLTALAERAEQPSASEGSWTCACRYMNSGPICTHCGALRPEAEHG